MSALSRMPSAVARMATVPGPTAVTKPFVVTVAIALFWVAHVTGRGITRLLESRTIAVSRIVGTSRTTSVSTGGVTVTDATGTGAVTVTTAVSFAESLAAVMVALPWLTPITIPR